MSERADFEVWFLDYCGAGPQGAVFDQASVGWLKRREDGHYEETRVRDAWTGWQGRAARSVIANAASAGHKLVPVNPPDALAEHLTDYSLSDNGMSQRDRRIVRERLERRWAAILAALSPSPSPEGSGNG